MWLLIYIYIYIYVIVRNRFIPFMGSQGLLLEPIPADSGRGQGTPWTCHQLIALTDGRGYPGANRTQEFNISLKDTLTCSSAHPGAGIWTSNLANRPALPTELQRTILLGLWRSKNLPSVSRQLLKLMGESVLGPQRITWRCNYTVWLLQQLASNPGAHPGGF